MWPTDEVLNAIAEADEVLECSNRPREWRFALQTVAGAMHRQATEIRAAQPDAAADLDRRVTALEAWSPDDVGPYDETFEWRAAVRGSAVATLAEVAAVTP